MINVPKCCTEYPFGFIEVKIEDNITRIPICGAHYGDNGSETVSIKLCQLEKNEKID